MNNPIKYTFKSEILSYIFLTLGFAASVYFYLNFPDQVPTHWNIQGEVDSYSSKFFTAFFFPLLNLILYMMLRGLPAFDPKKKRYQEFSHVYNLIKTSMVGFLTTIYFIIGLNGLGYTMNVSTITPILVGLLFIILGNYLGKIKRNWFLGLRTPWTMSSEEVWNKSQRFSGKMFVIAGLVMASIPLMPVEIKEIVLFSIILIVVIIPIIYSYLLYKKESAKRKQ